MLDDKQMSHHLEHQVSKCSDSMFKCPNPTPLEVAAYWQETSLKLLKVRQEVQRGLAA